MCLAVPGKVIELWASDGARLAKVDFGSDVKQVCLDFVPDIEVGEYTIVHMGYALQRIDEETALQTLALFREMGDLGMDTSSAWSADLDPGERAFG